MATYQLSLIFCALWVDEYLLPCCPPPATVLKIARKPAKIQFFSHFFLKFGLSRSVRVSCRYPKTVVVSKFGHMGGLYRVSKYVVWETPKYWLLQTPEVRDEHRILHSDVELSTLRPVDLILHLTNKTVTLQILSSTNAVRTVSYTIVTFTPHWYVNRVSKRMGRDGTTIELVSSSFDYNWTNPKRKFCGKLRQAANSKASLNKCRWSVRQSYGCGWDLARCGRLTEYRSVRNTRRPLTPLPHLPPTHPPHPPQPPPHPIANSVRNTDYRYFRYDEAGYYFAFRISGIKSIKWVASIYILTYSFQRTSH